MTSSFKELSNRRFILNCWPRWMSKQMAGLYIGFSTKQIERFVKSGSINYVRINGTGHLRIDRLDLDKFMEMNKVALSKNINRILKHIK